MKLTFSDVEKILQQFIILFPRHPIPDFPALAAIWHDALSTVSIDDARNAYALQIKMAKHFPVPAEFLQCVHETGGEV